MHTIDTYTLHGIALRLVDAIPAGRGEALILARWIAARPDIFGPVPDVAPAGRYRAGVDPLGWQVLRDHLGGRLQGMAEPPDQPLARLATIAAHLGLGPTETTILRFLVLQQRGGAVADFAATLRREIGVSDEAVIAWCCNLDEVEVWSALAPQGPLVAPGLVQPDGTSPVMRDEPYALSGLLLALLRPQVWKPPL